MERVWQSKCPRPESTVAISLLVPRSGFLVAWESGRLRRWSWLGGKYGEWLARWCELVHLLYADVLVSDDRDRTSREQPTRVDMSGELEDTCLDKIRRHE